MVLRGRRFIQLSYDYNHARYDITFPAGMPINYQEDIPYYGTLIPADMASRDGGVCIVK